MSAIITKKPLEIEDKPKLISKNFFDFNNNDLLLGYLENQNKLKKDISQVSGIPDHASGPTEFSYSEPPVVKSVHISYEVERDIENRDEMMWKLKKIRKQHKNIEIPIFDELTPTPTLVVYLRNALREINFNEKADNLKNLLLLFALGVEYIGTQYAGLNLTGFTTTQMHNIEDYEKTLMEMSERSYMGWSDRTSPELKLLFIFSKNIATYLMAGRGEILGYKMKGPGN